VSVPAFIGYGERSLHSLSPPQLAHVREVGLALFEGRCLQAKQGGFIAVLDTAPTQDVKGECNDEGQELQRSAAGPRQGRQRTSGRSGQSRRGSSDPSRAVVGRQRLISQTSGQLRKHYSGVRLWKEIGGNGVWLAVSIFPAGKVGPQADFVIAVPTNPTFRILSWGFWCTTDGPVWIGPKHTNYPDGSACPFPADGAAWTEAHDLIAYVDRLAEWSMRHLYLDAEGVWPGSHEGAHIYYRLRHTHPRECCTRCRSLNPYESCCLPLDQKEFVSSHRADFISMYGADVGDQRPHSRLLRWMETKEGSPPSMGRVHPDMRKAKGIGWAREH
jgi:hypothetical protein